MKYVHKVLRQKVEEIGNEDVILWGLSKGCATSLSACLTWEERRLQVSPEYAAVCNLQTFSTYVKAISTPTPTMAATIIVTTNMNDFGYSGTDNATLNCEDDIDPFSKSEDGAVVGVLHSLDNVQSELLVAFRDELE